MFGKWYIEQSREPGDRGGPYYHETQSVELTQSQGLRFSFDDPSLKKKETTLKKKLQRRFPVAKMLHIFSGNLRPFSQKTLFCNLKAHFIRILMV